MRRHLQWSVTFLAMVAALGCFGCGSAVNEALFQTLSATGRASIDAFLTELANNLAPEMPPPADAPDDGTADDSDDGSTDGTSDDDGPALDGPGAAGQAFFIENNCGACHADDAGGDFGPSLVGVESDVILERLTGGRDHPGGVFPGTTEEDTDNLAVWLASLEGGGGEPVGDPIAAGQDFFTANSCAVCHADDASGGLGPSIVDLDSDTLFDVLTGVMDHTGGATTETTQQDADDLAAWLAS